MHLSTNLSAQVQEQTLSERCFVGTLGNSRACTREYRPSELEGEDCQAGNGAQRQLTGIEFGRNQ
jgi:hypothetical protein